MFFACQRSFGYVLVSSEVSHRIAAMVSRRMAHAWLAHSGYPQAQCSTSREAVDRFDACAIRRELKDNQKLRVAQL